MIRAAYIDGVHQVIEHVLAGGHRGRGNQVGHEIDAEVPAAISQRLENIVGLVAGMRINGGAPRVRDQHRLGGAAMASEVVR